MTVADFAQNPIVVQQEHGQCHPSARACDDRRHLGGDAEISVLGGVDVDQGR